MPEISSRPLTTLVFRSHLEACGLALDHRELGVGLLCQLGCFCQFIDSEGNQTALFPYNEPGQLPITPVRNGDGEWVRVKVRVGGPTLRLRAWQASVGRVRLYLLDSNDPANAPVLRGATSELYGGGKELRLEQELVLGIGGWRLLRAIVSNRKSAI